MTAQRWVPFNRRIRRDIAAHVREVRRLFDWPGVPYHDADLPEASRFNRWQAHQLPLLRAYHHQPRFVAQVSRRAGESLKPSYVYLSLYGRDGVCPRHTDRPQCHITVDYLVQQDGQQAWPLYVEPPPGQPGEAVAHALRPGEALLYSGTQQAHWRAPMRADSDCTAVDLVFFHFVPVSFQGELR